MTQLHMSSKRNHQGEDDNRARNESLEPGKLSTGQSRDVVARGPDPSLSTGGLGGSCLLPSARRGSLGRGGMGLRELLWGPDSLDRYSMSRGNVSLGNSPGTEGLGGLMEEPGHLGPLSICRA